MNPQNNANNMSIEANNTTPPQEGQDPDAQAVAQLMEFLQELDNRVTALEQGERGEKPEVEQP